MPWKDRAADLGYGAGWRLVRALPEVVAATAADVGAELAVRRGSGTVQLRRNLARVLGVPAAEVSEDLVRAAMRSYARYWREAFRLPAMNHAKLAANVDADVEGQEHLDAALAAGRGAILALPHSGNFDVAGVWLVQHSGTFTTVAERLNPESLFARFTAYRESLGFEILPLTGGVESPIRGLVRRLRSGGVVCLVGDRDLSRAGIPVTFFGEQTKMPAGPARLARSTGAALLPVHCWFTPHGWRMRIHSPVDSGLDAAAATQAMADRFAEGIAEHPADWHMLQPLWLSDLDPSR
ncbi:MAG: phosphatidylinositol mannoside acyltransferase [Mycobacteriaceae bacterium]